jgi:outer membrane protein insertion porin family
VKSGRASSLPRHALAAAGALLLLAGAASRAFAIDEALLGALKRVEGVKIDGNRAIGTGTIKKVVKTGAHSFLGLSSLPLYRPDFLRSDQVAISNLYARRGYLDATVSANADSGSGPGRVVVHYHIVEGVRVDVAAVLLDSTAEFTPDELKHGLGTKVGRPYDPVQVTIDRTTLADRFADRGYFPVVKSDIHRDSTTVIVRFNISPGVPYHVARVTINGVVEIDTLAVRREILLNPGDLYAQKRLTQSTERLYQTGLFQSVELVPAQPDSVHGSVDLAARVRERKPRWVDVGVGTGTIERVRLSGQWGDRNLDGTGRSLTASGNFGYNRADSTNLFRTREELAYGEPWFLGTRTHGRVAASLEHGFEFVSTRIYLQQAYGLSFGLARELTKYHARVSLTLDNTWTTKSTVIRPDSTDTTFFIAPYIRRWTLAYDQDRRDDPINPRIGVLTHAAVQVAGSQAGGQGRYLKYELLEAGLAPQGARGVLGARVRVGLIQGLGKGPAGDFGVVDRVPVTDRFLVGGASSVRGYHENGIDDGGNGGRALLNMNFEWRFPLKGVLSGATFLDGGNVWRGLSDIKLERLVRANGLDGSFGESDMHWSAGAGVRLRTPVGPMRLDYGFHLSPSESERRFGRTPVRGSFQFSLGQLF